MSNSNMTPEQAAEVLRYLNEWRRGAEGEQPDPKTIGIAIDTAIECMSAPTPTDEFELKPCEKCYQLTNHIGDVCQKCKPKSNTPTELTVEKLDEISDKYIYIGADDKPYLSLAGAHEIIKAYFPTPTDYCPCTPDGTTGEMSANEGKTWQCNICGKTVNPSDHTRLNTPTDEQIGKLFDQHTDVSVLLNPISPTHAMTRTAAIQFARDVLTLGKSK